MRVLRTMVVVLALLAPIGAGLGAQASTTMGTSSAADREAAYAVITKLFDAMRARDTASMRAAFVPNASMQSLTPRGVTFDSIGGWIASVGRAPAGLLLDERLANAVVQVSDNLATVWVDYWFFAGERLSHCGVDAISLVREGDQWRIFSIVDTRRREGCPTAPAGTNRE